MLIDYSHLDLKDLVPKRRNLKNTNYASQERGRISLIWTSGKCLSIPSIIRLFRYQLQEPDKGDTEVPQITVSPHLQIDIPDTSLNSDQGKVTFQLIKFRRSRWR